MDVTELIERTRAELAPAHDRLRSHPYVAAVEDGRIDLAGLRPFAGEQRAIIASDLRSVAHLVSRTGDPFFLAVLDGERAALDALTPLAAALGMDERELEDYEPKAGAHAYAAYMAWLGAYASAAEVAAAYLVNFEAWGHSCGRLSRALRARHGLTAAQVRFFDAFAEDDPEFEPHALALIQAGLDAGVPERVIRRAPRLLQAYEALFWDTLHEAAGAP
jgi:pyrroloquinoline quinone (PQQ) biosynthesis protein C